jgi:DNA-binding CsgD family transcriptional regulator
MSRLNGRDLADVKQLTKLLRAPAPTSPWPEFVEALRRMVEAERAMLYSVRLSGTGYVVEDGHWAGFSRSSKEMNELCARLLGGVSRPWALFDPSLPQEEQRNRVFVLPPPRQWGDPQTMEQLRQLGYEESDWKNLVVRMESLNADALVKIEVADMSSCRALVCDGEELLAWVGVLRREPFGERERLLLRALLPVIRERLLSERLTKSAKVHAALARTLIESVGEPCFFVHADGTVELANEQGWAMARADPALLAEIRRVPQAPRSKRFITQSIADAGVTPLYLVRLSGQDGGDKRLATFTQLWRLSDREAMVLSRAANGLSNKEIATALGCQVRTVEFHMTKVFAKAGVEGRSALIARFWSG